MSAGDPQPESVSNLSQDLTSEDDTSAEATEALQARFQAVDLDPQDVSDIQAATQGLDPLQMGALLDGFMRVAMDPEIDFESLGQSAGISADRAEEIVIRVAAAHAKLIAQEFFPGEPELHAHFVKWAGEHQRMAYVKASEAVTRTQSPRPMKALFGKYGEFLKAQAASRQQQQRSSTPTTTASKAIRTRTQWFDAYNDGTPQADLPDFASMINE